MKINRLLIIPVVIAVTSFKPLTVVLPVSLADKHKNDIGLAQDPDVLYTENFNDGLDKICSRYTDVRNRAGMWLDSTDVPEGSKFPAMVMTNKGGVNDGGHLYRLFKPGFDGTVYVRYYVKYPASSKGYIHHESVWFGGYNPATRWPDPRAGICGLGDKRLSVAYEPINAPKMDTYLYWGDMRAGTGKCYGNDVINGSPTAQSLTWDKWMCVEIMVKLNNPVSAYNGELRVWQDGKEVGHWGQDFPNGYWNADSWFNDPAKSPFEGFRWRTDANLNINYLWIEFYDDQSPAGALHHIKYANLVVARKYIGPIRK
jgi:hypothetical protein